MARVIEIGYTYRIFGDDPKRGDAIGKVERLVGSEGDYQVRVFGDSSGQSEVINEEDIGGRVVIVDAKEYDKDGHLV